MIDCLTVLLTTTCTDDGLWIDRVPEATGYVTEAYTWFSGWLVPWLVQVHPQCQAERCFLPLGCLSHSSWIGVRSLDAAGRPGAANWFYWFRGGGRYIDATNRADLSAPLCGVAL